MTLRFVWPGTFLAAIVVLGACAGSVDCTLAGASSSVRVDGTQVTVTEICLDDECVNAQGEYPVFPVGDSPASYRYRVEYVDPDGVTQSVEGVVETKEYFVNGKDCGPQTANATLSIAADGVTVLHP